MAHNIETNRRNSGESILAIRSDDDDRVLARISIRSDDAGNTSIQVTNNEGMITISPVASNAVILLTDRG